MTGKPRGFWTIWTAVAIDLLGFGIVIPLLPLYAQRFGASPFTIGLLFASYSLAQFLFAPVWGKLSDRIGRKPVLLVTIAGSALGSLTVGLAGSLTVLFVGRIIDGVSGASVAVARATVADMVEPHLRPRLMGLLGAAFGVGFVLGPSLGAFAALFGPSVPFFVASGLSLVNLVVGWRRIEETRVSAISPPDGATRLPQAALRLVLLSFVAVTAFSAFEATLSLLGNHRLGLNESAVALLFAFVGVVLVVTQGGLVGGVTHRLGEGATLRVGLALDLAGFSFLTFANSLSALLAALTLLALGQGLLTPVLSSAIAGSVPARSSGAALGFQQSAGGLARVIGPLMGGWLFATSVSLPYLAAGLLALLGILLIPAHNPLAADH